ncbi:MAG: alpha/beta hydrolase [Campylobacterales bacterium]|nr:alpha/beta hydrolase [Campylobacterales bacterium]
MNRVIDGLNILIEGNKENQPIIFVHGFPFDHTIWNDVITNLENRYFCISYDIRGFGDSEHRSGQYTMESFVDDLELVITKFELKDVIVCGFSMGGYITLRANERLGNFKALILANTMTTSDSDEAKIKRAAAIKKIDIEGVDSFLEQFLNVAFSKKYITQHPKEMEDMKNKILRFSSIGIKGGLLAMISRTDTTKSLKNIDIPTLLISAKDDAIIAPKVMENMAKVIKKSKYVELKNSGHVSMLENPKDFLKTLEEFLKEL